MKLPQSAHRISLFAMCSFLCVLGTTQIWSAPTNPQVSITSTEVNDDRHAQNASLTVRLGLRSNMFTSAQALRARVVTAEDATGRSLTNTKPFALSAFADDFEEIGKSDKADVDLRLASPPRTVMTLKQITGELEIYTPSKDPKSVVITKLAQQGNAPLTDPVLRSAGVNVTVWTAERYERYKQAQVKKKGIGEALSQGFGEVLGQMFGGSTDNKNNIVFRIKDPSLRLVKITIVDAQGKLIDTKGKLKMGSTREMDETFKFDKKLPANAKIKLYVATPKSLVKVPFQAQNIDLP